MSEEGYAAMGQGIADFVDDVVGYQGHDSHARQKRSLNLQYNQAQQHQPLINQANFDGRMASFEKHGIHPLFGMGGNPGSAPAFSMAGQAQTGSHKTDGMANLIAVLLANRGKETEKDLQAQQNINSAMRLAENRTNPTQVKGMFNQAIAEEAKAKGSAIVHKVDMKKDTSSQGLVEIKPAEQLTHAKGDRSVNPADLSIKRKMYTSNDQWLWVPNIQELDSLMEEPLVALGSIGALNPDLSTKQIRQQLRGLGYKFEEPAPINKGRMTILDWGKHLKITKRIPFKSRGRYVK